METNKWGYLNKTKWVLVVTAPFSASGLNEIIASAEHRSMLLNVAKLLRVRLTARSGYTIVRLSDINNIEDQV